jgi:2-dehydro-3-deoxygalactonokinase
MHIAIEWTSAAFHAYRLSGDGDVVAERSSAQGVNSVVAGGFEAALRHEVGDWLADAEAVLLSGMVTSRNGWIETPYAATPASAEALAAQAVPKHIEGLPPLFFLPGVSQNSPLPDVMRGEEIGVLGMGVADGMLVLPGAHSKWVRLEGGAIAGVTTYLTGELIGFLKSGSIVSRLIPADPVPDDAAFALGVANSAERPLGHLFSARSLPLFERLAAAHIPSYLDGLVIGAELREQLAAGQPIHLPRPHPLAAKYQTAMRLLGFEATLAEPNPARGFHQVWRKLSLAPA